MGAKGAMYSCHFLLTVARRHRPIGQKLHQQARPCADTCESCHKGATNAPQGIRAQVIWLTTGFASTYLAEGQRITPSALINASRHTHTVMSVHLTAVFSLWDVASIFSTPGLPVAAQAQAAAAKVTHTGDVRALAPNELQPPEA